MSETDANMIVHTYSDTYEYISVSLSLSVCKSKASFVQIDNTYMSEWLRCSAHIALSQQIHMACILVNVLCVSKCCGSCEWTCLLACVYVCHCVSECVYEWANERTIERASERTQQTHGKDKSNELYFLLKLIHYVVTLWQEKSLHEIFIYDVTKNIYTSFSFCYIFF